MVIVEGAQAAGKTTMIEHFKKYGTAFYRDTGTYKFPYVNYFRTFLKKYEGDTGDGSRECHHFTTGYDVALLSLAKSVDLSKLVVDRGFITNIVFSIVEHRADENEGLQYIDWLGTEGLLDRASIVYVRRENKDFTPERNKDEWEFLHKAGGYAEQDALYKKFIDYAKSKYFVQVREVFNQFDTKSLLAFDDAVEELLEGWQPVDVDTIKPGKVYSFVTKDTDYTYHNSLYIPGQQAFITNTDKTMLEVPVSNVLKYRVQHE